MSKCPRVCVCMRWLVCLWHAYYSLVQCVFISLNLHHHGNRFAVNRWIINVRQTFIVHFVCDNCVKADTVSRNFIKSIPNFILEYGRFLNCVIQRFTVFICVSLRIGKFLLTRSAWNKNKLNIYCIFIFVSEHA